MKVVNIVLSGKFRKSINLSSLPDCRYNARKFSGGVYKHENCTFLLFSNGSFVCLGAQSKRDARLGVASLASLLNTKISFCRAKNVVVSHNMNFEIDMGSLYNFLRSLFKTVIYEDELFNGMTWKVNGGTVRLFHNGKFFVTGLRSVRETQLVCMEVKRLCGKYRKRI